VEEQNKQLFLEARERRRDTEAEVRRSSLVEPVSIFECVDKLTLYSA